MARKLLFRSKDLPYHVTARSNNREWFTLPLRKVWRIFGDVTQIVSDRYGLLVHAFVLMSNHFHLLCATPEADLGQAMNYLMRQVSKAIGSETGRINRIFGARYHWSVIDNPLYFAHAYKYVMRNPVEARIVTEVESYSYSSL